MSNPEQQENSQNKARSPEEIRPQVGTSVLMETSLPTTSVQTGTTVLIDGAIAKNEHPQTGTSILRESLLPTVPNPTVSMLGESTLPGIKPPQVTLLPNDLLPSIPPQKMPRLVD